MENFIIGYFGYENEMRKVMFEVFGQEKYDFFFDKVCFVVFFFIIDYGLIFVKFFEYFFIFFDVCFFVFFGLNCICIFINYYYFFDDYNLGIIKQEGFKFIDCIVDVCVVEGLYIIIDMYIFFGG